MASSSGPSLKDQRSVSSTDDDILLSPVVSGTPSQRRAVSKFEEDLTGGLRSDCVTRLKNDLESLTWPGSPLEWLKEPLGMKFTHEEVVDVILNEKEWGPWIPYEMQQSPMPRMDTDFHQANCVHQSVHHTSKSMKLLPTETKRVIAEYCGLGGVNLRERLIGQVRFEDSTAYISYRYPDEDELDDTQLAQKALERCLLALERIIYLCFWLQSTGWVCNQIVVIRFSHGFQSASIPFSLIVQLRACVVEAIARHSLHPDLGNSRMFDTALELLWMEAPSLSSRWRLENAVDVCALAVQMLSLSLLSVCTAHVGPIHPFFLDRPMEKICLSGIDGSISKEHKLRFQLGGLACLGLMLQSPVMVFASGWPPVVQDDSRDALETSVEHLAELWGPVRLIKQRTDDVDAIEIGEGVVYKPPEPQADLHWVPGRLSERLNRVSFDITGRITVGNLFSVNQNCPFDQQHHTVPRSVILQEFHALGTWSEYYQLQQIQTGLQIGQYANASLNATWLRCVSRTRKEQGLAAVGSDFLDQPWGLLVSLCTGVARRVPLRHVIAEVFLDTMRAWMDRPEIRQDTNGTFEIFEHLQDPSFRQWLSSLSYSDRNAATRCMEHILGMLCWTGINRKSKLVTACTSFEESSGCIHISLDEFPVLTKILRDTNDSATFASLSTKCVVTEVHGCQETVCPEWKNKVSALVTSVCQYYHKEKVPNQGLGHGLKYWMGPADEPCRLIAEVSGVQGNKTILKVTVGLSPWWFYVRGYEMYKKRCITLREQSYIGEEGAQEVLIVSG